MNVAASDRPLLVAPRPVRISSGHFTRTQPVAFIPQPQEQFGRMKVPDGNELEDLKIGLYPDSSSVSDKEMASPRASSRSSLPSEALEEFLSILRPTFFAPTSPIFRARPHGSTLSLPNIPCERPYPFKNRLEVVQQKNLSNGLLGAEDSDRMQTQPTPDASSSTPESDQEGIVEFDSDLLARWNIAHCHSSPISRMQTRNPFQRPPSYEMPLSPTTPLSPATADPLPLPPLDEVAEGS